MISPLRGKSLRSQSFAWRGISKLSPFNSYRILPMPSLEAAEAEVADPLLPDLVHELWAGSTSTLPTASLWTTTENCTVPGARSLMRVAMSCPGWAGSSATVNSLSSDSLGLRVTSRHSLKWKKILASRSAHRMNPNPSLMVFIVPCSLLSSETCKMFKSVIKVSFQSYVMLMKIYW